MVQGIWNSEPYQKFLMGMVICRYLAHQAWLEVLFPRQTVLELHVYPVGRLTSSRCYSPSERLQSLQPKESVIIHKTGHNEHTEFALYGSITQALYKTGYEASFPIFIIIYSKTFSSPPLEKVN